MPRIILTLLNLLKFTLNNLYDNNEGCIFEVKQNDTKGK